MTGLREGILISHSRSLDATGIRLQTGTSEKMKGFFSPKVGRRQKRKWGTAVREEELSYATGLGLTAEAPASTGSATVPSPARTSGPR